jgi:hypothetical protein
MASCRGSEREVIPVCRSNEAGIPRGCYVNALMTEGVP